MGDFQENKSFGQVDEKVAEADFFLKKLQTTVDLHEARFYFSAFATASRSITFTLQSVMHDIPGFAEWYKRWQNKLKSNDLAKIFVGYRNCIQKTGMNPLNGGTFAKGHIAYRSSDIGPEDIAIYCKAYLSAVIECIYQCYVDFGPHIDPHMYYTEENFSGKQMTIEDAEKELGLPRGWTKTPFLRDEHRWAMIRATVAGCQIKTVFEEYLGKSIPEPEPVELPEDYDIRVKQYLANKGWHVEDGFWLAPTSVSENLAFE